MSFYRAVYYVPSLLGGSVAIAILVLQIIAGFTAANFAMSGRWVFYADDRKVR